MPVPTAKRMTTSDKDQTDREMLIRLVNRIQNESGCIVDLDALINKFEKSVKYPSASRLIFDPPDGRRRSPEEIVDVALGVQQNLE